MGLFSVRRTASKDVQQENLLSPSKASSAVLSKLFADDNSDTEDQNDDALSYSQASDSSLTKSIQEMTIDRQKSTSTSPTSASDKERMTWNNRASGRKSKLDIGNANKNESMSRLARRDSIKRSLSRKLARSESRRQMLNIKDDHTSKRTPKLPPTIERGRQMNSISPDGHGSGMGHKDQKVSMSPVTPAISSTSPASASSSISAMGDLKSNQSENKLQSLNNMTKEEVEKLTAIEELNTDDSVAPISESSSLALTLEAATFAMPNADAVPSTSSINSTPSKVRSRKRPPPLVGTQGKATDSSSDWANSVGVFASDGGFITGGFRITTEGMLNRPDIETRQDSDPEADEAPRSSETKIAVGGLKEFRNGPVIGAGAAGRVYLAEHIPSKATMAIKTVNVYNKEKRNQLLKELETLCKHNSRYLVRFHGAFYDGSGAVHIALEYMDHGCLSSFIQRVGKIPEHIVKMIAQDCLRGLRFLHRHHVLHRDFKTANILLSRRICRAKLSDFGLARDLNPGVSKVDTFVGTVAYMSPERLQGGKYTYASDIWALGVSLVECLIGHHPFNTPQNYFDYIEATVASGTLQGFHSDSQFSAEVKDFVTQCTYTDPKKRPKAVDLLEHPWIKDMRRDAQAFGSWLDEARTISMQVSSTKMKA